MRIARFVLAAVLAIASSGFAQTVAFERAGAAWVSPLTGGKPKRVAADVYPELSPDGRRLAFNTQDGDTPKRFIAVLDLATGKRTVFKDVPSDNAFGPVWSPDGARLAFSIFFKDDWRLGLINADGTGFRFVGPSEGKGRTLWGAAWAADGRSLFVQDLDQLRQIDLDGRTLRRWSIAELFPRGGLNSGARLSPSPDGKSLLIDVDMDEAAERDEWAGPPPAIFQLDLASGETRRITKPDAFAWYPAWINEREILVNSWPAGQKDIGISRLPLDGKGDAKLLFKNARNPSVANP